MSEEAIEQPPTNEVTAKSSTSRQSRWRTSWEACQHIANAFASNELQVRTADKVTLGLLLISAAMAVAMVVFPDAYVAIACDVFVALTIAFYLAQRFGIIKTFDTKQTVFATEIIIGFFILGIFIVVNLTVWFLQKQ